jgi:EAL domain-containing protein (putative c-di-GMP-specific phosphodiesterase class I)
LATVVAGRLVEALAAPLALEMRDVQTAVSVGIAIGRPGLDDADALLRNADVAMYAAKAKGKNGWELFQPAMHEAVLERLEMGRALRLALDAGEFELHYQPIVHLTSGEVAGVEALVRWNHPERGIVLPDEFIPLAEETGFVVALGHWVLTRAAMQAKAWQAANPELFMSVNLSARQLQEPNLVTDIAGILATSGMSPTTLVLEITETVLMRDAELANSALATLRRLGIRLALDDFGTGYSSLSYLQQFPVDILKIDKSFIDGTGEGGHALAAAIVELGRSLGLKMVAEGVEHSEQADWLERLGCDRAQGYYFGRPVTAAEVTALLEPQPRVAAHR